MRKFILGAATLALMSCGSSSNAMYIRAVAAVASAPSGTNCSSQNNGITEVLTNEGSLNDAAIYLTPTNTALTCSGPCNATLDLGLNGATLLNGTQNGNSYTFSGKIIDDEKSTNEEIIFEDDITVQLTVNGNAVSGTETVETKVACQNGCSGFTDNSDCSSSAGFQGTVIAGIQDQTTLGNTSNN